MLDGEVEDTEEGVFVVVPLLDREIHIISKKLGLREIKELRRAGERKRAHEFTLKLLCPRHGVGLTFHEHDGFADGVDVGANPTIFGEGFRTEGWRGEMLRHGRLAEGARKSKCG